MSIKVLDGGRIRRGFTPVQDTDVVWEAGIYGAMDGDGYVNICTDPANSGLNGIAMERKGTNFPPEAGGDETGQAQGYGNLGKVSLLMDEAVVRTDRLASGVTFAAGDAVHVTTGGLYTTSDTNNRVGTALAAAVQASGDELTFLFFGTHGLTT